jgi:hypothetical protein
VTAPPPFIAGRSPDRRLSPPGPQQTTEANGDGTRGQGRRREIRVGRGRRPAPERRRCRELKQCAAGEGRRVRPRAARRGKTPGRSTPDRPKRHIGCRIGPSTNRIATKTASRPAPRARRRPDGLPHGLKGRSTAAPTGRRSQASARGSKRSFHGIATSSAPRIIERTEIEQIVILVKPSAALSRRYRRRPQARRRASGLWRALPR